jgi:hypothetical protein
LQDPIFDRPRPGTAVTNFCCGCQMDMIQKDRFEHDIFRLGKVQEVASCVAIGVQGTSQSNRVCFFLKARFDRKRLKSIDYIWL